MATRLCRTCIVLLPAVHSHEPVVMYANPWPPSGCAPVCNIWLWGWCLIKVGWITHAGRQLCLISCTLMGFHFKERKCREVGSVVQGCKTCPLWYFPNLMPPLHGSCSVWGAMLLRQGMVAVKVMAAAMAVVTAAVTAATAVMMVAATVAVRMMVVVEVVARPTAY